MYDKIHYKVKKKKKETGNINSDGKNLPEMQETRVGSLVREDPLEQEMATHSRILAWKIA